ncbi:hypothetical protein TanjilG_06125 [Lupinus angustifolius]|uniref:KNOX2 domain-containing protein n=1 Tax=Lupinus angustifolius TaxID=3871 RepID=A0A1J7GST9_LUPAN|nr:PREDICTED: protein KNATM-like [Lupinus angustifolius]OIW03616.1 hypothetical protein TanjilG_06125 [Lupinus angustifolius]
MESKSNEKNYERQHKDEELEQEQEGEQENNEILKRRISSHPLYGLLVETHLECLKVGDISNLDSVLKIDHEMQSMKKQNLGMFSQTELDLFMEAYCMALGQLKEAIEEPQKKSMAFINNMHSQLRELTMVTMHAPADATSSSECKFRRNPTI